MEYVTISSLNIPLFFIKSHERVHSFVCGLMFFTERCPLTFLIVLDHDALICPVTGAPIKRVKPVLSDEEGQMFQMMFMSSTSRPVHPLCGASL
jgi:hypothetical protein